MRKQRLPKEFWTDISPSDKNTYCFWYGKSIKKHQTSEKEARAFVNRAKERNVAAFATTYIEQESEHQVFACSFCGILKKYSAVDWVNLEIASANYKLIHYPEKMADKKSNTRNLEQWGHKDYGAKYENATYHVSWYNTQTHRFEGKEYDTFAVANKEFISKQASDTPVRLVEQLSGSNRIHEIKAACQHWFIGMGTYLNQIANKTLPIGEIPYMFSNKYNASQLEIDDGCGWLDFRVGFDNYTVQIGRPCNGIPVFVYKELSTSHMYYVVIDDNPIMEPWTIKLR